MERFLKVSVIVCVVFAMILATIGVGCTTTTATTTAAAATTAAATTAAATTAAATTAADTTAAETTAAPEPWVYGISDLTFAHPFHREYVELQPTVDENFGCKSIMKNAEMNIEVQLADIDNLIEQKVDVLQVIPIDAVAAESGVQKAIDAGIPTFIGANKVNVEGVTNALLGDYKTFYNIGLALAAYLNGKGKVCFVSGLKGNTASDEREQGFLDAMKVYPDIEVLAVKPCDWDPTKAVSIVQDWLNKYDQIDAIGFADDSLALPSIEAMNSAGKKDIVVTGYSGVEEGFKAVEDGRILIDALINPTVFAWYTSQIAYLLHNKVELPTDMSVDVPLVLNQDIADKLKANGMKDYDKLVWVTVEQGRDFGKKAPDIWGKAATDKQYGLNQ